MRGLTGGEGVAAVYDSVGKDTFDASLASLRRRGTLVLYGGSSGQVPPFDPQRLNAGGSLFLTRPKLADHTATRAELVERATEVLGAVAGGTLHVRVGATFPLADAADAHRALEDGRPPARCCSGRPGRTTLPPPRPARRPARRPGPRELGLGAAAPG